MARTRLGAHATGATAEAEMRDLTAEVTAFAPLLKALHLVRWTSNPHDFAQRERLRVTVEKLKLEIKEQRDVSQVHP